MAAIYVRKTGNDSTGDGSTGTPYLTIAKAESVAAAGDEIIIGSGDYSEDNGSGRLTFDQVNATPVIVRSETGRLGDVRVRAATNWIVVTGAGFTFQGLSFLGNPAKENIMQVSGTNVARLRFLDCEFVVDASTSTVQYGLNGFNTSAGAHSGVEIVGCTFRQVGLGRSGGLYFNCGSSGVGTYPGLLIQRSRFLMNGYCVRLGEGVVGVSVLDNDITSFATGSVTDHALLLGVDGQAGALSSGLIAGNRIYNGQGHTLIVGAGVVGADVVDNTISGGIGASVSLDLGIVIKQCENVSVRRNVIDARGAAGLYFKAARDCEAYDNEITVRRHANGSGIRTDSDNIGGAKCSGLTVRRNRVRASIGTALQMGASSLDAGCLVDENVYEVTGTAALGFTYGGTVTNIRALRASWSGYDQSNNDRNSRIGSQQAVFAGAPIASL